MTRPVTASPASDPRASAWVSANAGAGKTHLLADRVTRLLLDGAGPDRILCLTYTKAAAAEMSGRLFQRLGEWALLPDAELRDKLSAIGAPYQDAEALSVARRLFAQALETPGGLKIQTIHSFCQHVLARFPLEAGIPARFMVLDERSALELMHAARTRVLERAYAGDEKLAASVEVLATRAADSRFAEILDLAIGHAGRLRELVARHGGERNFFAHLRRTLDVADDEDETAILTRFCTELGGEKADCEKVANWLLGGSKSDIVYGRALSRFIARQFSADAIEHLSEMLVTLSGPRQRLATTALARAQPVLMTWLQQLQQRYIAMEERRKAAVTAGLTEALISVAFAVLDEYEQAKAARAALDYDDLIRATLALIERGDAASWVLYKLDGGLDHILVDEAQDTSPEQWRIVARLSDEFYAGRGARVEARGDSKPRTVFAVGDEKQSIFSFQGAAPEEFGRNLALFKARTIDAELHFVEQRPAVSRRSAKAILSFVDEVFADATARDGLTSTEAPILHEPYRSETGRVELWPTVPAPDTDASDPWDLPVDAPSPTGAHVVLASRVAERIATWLREGATVPGTGVPIEPGRIMILVRRRNAFSEEMIRQLVQRRVPVAGADRMVLIDQIAILDLLALGRFAILPEDDYNLAALLKSPMLGLGEDDVYQLCQPRSGRLWDELRARRNEQAVFKQAHNFLESMLAAADFAPPFEFYSRVLSKDVRRKIVARLGPEAGDAIDEFLALALAHEGVHAPSLESFLDWFARGASEVKRDMEQSGGAVRVMTVHGAKGLEADIVIVPDTAQVPDHERRSGLLFSDDCVFFGVPKALETPAIVQAKTAARQREMREYRRLLYVALTRARDWLILCGYEMKTPRVHADSWYPLLQRAMQRIGRPEPDERGETIHAFGLDTTPPRGRGPIAIPPAEVPLPEFLSRAPADILPAQRVLRPSDAADDSIVISPADSARRFRRGLLVHALLAILPDVTPDTRREAARKYLTRHSVEPDDAASLIAETMAIIDHADFAPLFAPGSRAEISIVATLPELGEGVRINGQIDRLAVTETSVLIADFKTNRPPPKTVAETPSLYLAQMALYRAALSRLYPGRRVSCALVWTHEARLMPLPDSLLDAEVERLRLRQNTQSLV
jgi:ATP-dependent helicase/nuclease subunit A